MTTALSSRVRRPPRPGGLVSTRSSGAPDTEWMQLGACRRRPDVDFFPVDGAGVARAKRVCALCPVCAECLEYALVEGVTHGVWGGVSDRQRQKLRAARGLTEVLFSDG